MRHRSSRQREGERVLLDLWQPPDGAGSPIGCLASSYTFSASLFEEECLARFMGIESDPASRDWLIEREERMAAVDCMAALVDAQHCRGRRSLRWDLLPVRVGNGILHAKIWLMLWNHHLRVVVGSANLTEEGCRKNQEVVGVLDYRENSSAPRNCLSPLLGFLRDIVELQGEGPAAKRCQSLLVRAQGMSRRWGQAGDGGVTPVLIAPGRQTALRQLQRRWGRQTKAQPQMARVISPFFDPPEARLNAPVKALRKWLSPNKQARIEWCVSADLPAEPSGTTHIKAPQSLLARDERDWQGDDVFLRVIENPKENGIPQPRPLHAKALGLSGGGWEAMMIGSSNFTSAGLGMGRRVNWEANLFYMANRRSERKRAKALERGVVDTEEIIGDRHLWQWAPHGDEAGEAGSQLPILPAGFVRAVLAQAEGGHELRLTFDVGKGMPEGSEVFAVNDEPPLWRMVSWQEQGSPSKVVIPWPKDRGLPSGLEVAWRDAEARAWWPVEVKEQRVLPPPAALRDLDIDTLLRLLTSSRPLHRVLFGWHEGVTGDDPKTRQMLDPHARVDTRHFFLQRVRRASWALSCLRERPVPTDSALDWRLHGPIGPRSVARALIRETERLEDADLAAAEQAFMLAELALELSYLQPQDAPPALPKKKVLAEVAQVIKWVMKEAGRASDAVTDKGLRKYVASSVRREVNRRIREWKA